MANLPELDADEILKMNDKITVFSLISLEATSRSDVQLFLLKKPRSAVDIIEELKPIESWSKFCKHCLNALQYLAFYIDTARRTGRKGMDEGNLTAGCVVHQNLDTLDGGCHLCTLIHSHLNLYWYFNTKLVQESSIEMCWQSDIDLWSTDDEEADSQMARAGPCRLHFALAHPSKRTQGTYLNFLRLQFIPTEKYPGLFLNHEGKPETGEGGGEVGPKPVQIRREASTESETTRKLALEWLRCCKENDDGQHNECNRTFGEQAPTRLLDVEGAMSGGLLKLATQETNATDFAPGMEYATLSHCWGQWGASELPSLKSHNFDQRIRAGIDMATLPSTFRDAIKVAHWFHIKWLWIDSLCILQDSRTDWEYEASHMSHVYRDAVCNISADASFDARGGCFRERFPTTVFPIRLGLPETEGASFWLTADDPHCFKAVTTAPLSDRAWCFQERQLARRVIHFTDNEVIWECCAGNNYFRSETYPNGGPVSRTFNRKPKFQSHGGLEGQNLYRTWNEMCKTYSERHLTHSTDKLIAISGLAKEFGRLASEDTYIAGLWKSTLPQGLLWESAATAQRYVPKDDYVAPSWSWASIDGEISNMWGDFDQYDDNSNAQPVADIIDISLDTLSPSDPFSPLKGASITIKGILTRVQIRPDSEKKPWYMLAIGGGHFHELTVYDGKKSMEMKLTPTGRNVPNFGFSFDRKFEEGAPVEAYFLPIDIRGPVNDRATTVRGLLLEQSDEADTFSRVGKLDVMGSNVDLVKYKLKHNDAGSTESEKSVWDRLYPRDEPDEESSGKMDGDTLKIDELTISGRNPKTSVGTMAYNNLFAFDAEYNKDLFERIEARYVKLV